MTSIKKIILGLITATECMNLCAGAETNRFYPATPVALKCENAVNPFIGDPAPRLAWKLDDSRQGAAQTAYRILAATSELTLKADTGDLWDSGRIAGDQSIWIPYAGRQLQSQQKVFWKVKVWDQDGKESPWSNPSGWETALLHPADWKAKWIRIPADRLLKEQDTSGIYQYDEALGEWLCGEGIVRTHFRKSFELPVALQNIQSAELVLQSDNRTDIYINGQAAIPDSFCERGLCRIPVGDKLQSGKNTVAIRFFMSANPDWIFSAFRCGLVITARSGEIYRIASDSSWREAPLAFRGPKGPDRFVLNDDWTGVDYNDSDFIVPTYHDVIHPAIRRRSAQFKKEFFIQTTDQTDQARLYITAKGLYDVWINGKRPGDAVLTPGCSETDTLYQAYDVSGLIHNGNNLIEVRTASGWYAEPNHWNGWKFQRQQLIADLIWADEKGAQVHMGTDESWLTCPSPVLQDSRYFGERYDARVEEKMRDPAYWIHPEAETVDLNKSFVLYAAEPTKVTSTVKPASIIRKGDDWLFDFGTELTGRVTLRLNNQPAGKRVVLRYGEALGSDELFYEKPYEVYPVYPDAQEVEPGIRKGMDVYIPAGREMETYVPAFTFTGYRYVLVKGLAEVPDLQTLEARMISHSAEEIGFFECSELLINTIWQMARKTHDCNFIEYPMDCASREQGPWVGDAHSFAPLACYHRDLSRFYRKWFSNGPFIPSVGVSNNHRAGWFDGYLRLPQISYQYFGDDRIIHESLDRMRRLVDERIARLEANGFNGINDPENGDHLGYQYVNNKLYRSLWWIWSFRAMAENLESAGRTDDAGFYRAAYVKWLPEFQKNFYAGDTKGYYYPDEGDRLINEHANSLQAGFDRNESSQTAQVLALALGLVPAEKTAAVTSVLAENIRENGTRIQTGLQGTHQLFSVLAENGFADLAAELMLSKEFPSWGYMAEKGALTMTESWETEGVMSHPCLAGGVAWIFRNLAGIQPLKPGFKTTGLFPVIPEQLCRVSSSYDCPYGIVRSAWQKQEDGRVLWNVTVPPNTTAVARAPDGMIFSDGTVCRELSSGSFKLIMKKAKS